MVPRLADIRRVRRLLRTLAALRTQHPSVTPPADDIEAKQALRHRRYHPSVPTERDDLLPELAAGLLDELPGGGVLRVLGARISRAVLEEWRRNCSLTLRIATEHAGMSREDVAEALEREPKLAPLFVRVLYASGMNGHDKTLKLLAGFLGEALADVTRIDDVALMLSVIADFSEHHIKILELLATPVAGAELPRKTEATSWTTGLVVAASDMRPELALAASQGLLNAGFLSDAGLDGGGATYGDMSEGGTILVLTELGQTVLEVLRSVAEREGSRD